MIEQMDVGMIFLTTVIIAPVMEELVFRKYLVDRLVPYGQKTAVVLSGLFFGTVSWKFLSVFLCAHSWVVFAWMYSTPDASAYNHCMHMLINLLGGVLPVVLSRSADAGKSVCVSGLWIPEHFCLRQHGDRCDSFWHPITSDPLVFRWVHREENMAAYLPEGTWSLVLSGWKCSAVFTG